MAPPGWKIVDTIPRLSGIPRDAVDITWYVTDPIPVGFDALRETLYTGTSPGQSTPISMWMGPQLKSGPAALTYKAYQIPVTHGPMGPPKFTGSMNWSAPSSSTHALPSQDALAVSFHADYTSIPEHAPPLRPRSSYRGRIYFGPLAQNVVVNETTTNEPVVFATVLSDFAAAFKAFLASAAGGSWSVFSKRNWVLHPVVAGWVDNRIDTQRRRQQDPDFRYLWP